MSELLSGLVDEGLVVRASSPGRGHPVPAELTDDGRHRLRQCERIIAAVESSLGLPPSERALLNTLLHTVLTAQ